MAGREGRGSWVGREDRSLTQPTGGSVFIAGSGNLDVSIRGINSRRRWRSEDYRQGVVEEAIRTRLTGQIGSMGEDRANPWDYRQFAEQLGKKVSWAYRLEDPNEEERQRQFRQSAARKL
jgi:hypothetical protein